uniref:RRM domain-containing protein n=1 Tax=Ceratitis capitata TaxID=7213 RepID=W8CCN8_CERCA
MSCMENRALREYFNSDPDDDWRYWTSPEYATYFISNQIAYTEDYVRIRNLFISGLSNKISSMELGKHFQQFGEVEDILMKPCGGRALVFFTKAEEACRALQKMYQFIEQIEIKVNPAYSWLQPDTDEACKREPDNATLKSLSNENSPPDDSNILPIALANEPINSIFSINVYCIVAIFRQLKPGAQMRLVRTNKRFLEVFKTYSCFEHKRFNLNQLNEMTLWEIRDLLQYAGKYMVEMRGSLPFKNRTTIMNFIRKCCPKLKKLQITNCGLKLTSFKNFIKSFSHLRTLDFTDGCLEDKHIQACQNVKNLDTLVLDGNVLITGAYIKDIVTIRVLKLYGCIRVETQNLIEISMALENLRTLDIRRIHGLDLSFYSVIDYQCQQLVDLKMTRSAYQYDRVALLPRLEHLEIIYPLPGEEIFVPLKLAIHKAQQLKTLKIYCKRSLTPEHIDSISQLKQLRSLSIAFNFRVINDAALKKLCRLTQLEELIIVRSYDITNDALLKLLKSCPKLSVLNIQFCEKISMEFVLRSIEILKARRVHSKQPLVVYTCYTAIKESDLNECAKYKEAERSGLLKIDTSYSDELEDVYSSIRYPFDGVRINGKFFPYTDNDE